MKEITGTRRKRQKTIAVSRQLMVSFEDLKIRKNEREPRPPPFSGGKVSNLRKRLANKIAHHAGPAEK
jgi:hypothetical protein